MSDTMFEIVIKEKMLCMRGMDGKRRGIIDGTAGLKISMRGQRKYSCKREGVYV
jgi:hypothetical protein